jgi:phage I-like protein
VDFNADAQKLIRQKKYRYFSPALDWGATDKKTGRNKGATITSAALTNHPFLEELPAIELSEKAGRVVDKMVVPTVEDLSDITRSEASERFAAVGCAGHERVAPPATV